MKPRIDVDNEVNFEGKSNLWYAVLAALIAGLLTAAAWAYLDAQERRHIKHVSGITARTVEALIRQDLELRVSALVKLADDWSDSSGLTRERWQLKARNILDLQTGYQAIEWADPAFQIRWIMPQEGNEAAQDFNLSENQVAHEAAKLARSKGIPVLAGPFDLVQGELGLVIYVPIHKDSKFGGLIIGVVRVKPWLAVLLPSELSTQHQVKISISEALIYSGRDETIASDQTYTDNNHFELYDLVWDIDTISTSEYLSLGRERFKMVFFLVGLLLATLTALTVYAFRSSHANARRLIITGERLTTLFENLPGVAYRVGDERNWPIDFATDGCEAITGYTLQEFQKQTVSWRGLIVPEDVETIRAEMITARGNSGHYELEYRIIKKSGERRWIWDRGRIIPIADGKEYRREGIISDITARKKSESLVLEAQGYSAAIVETAVEAVITIDSKGRIATFNRAAHEMFGYTFEEVRGKNVNLLMPEPFHSDHDRYIERYLESGNPKIIGTGREVMAKTKDGIVFPIYLSVGEIKNQPERRFVGLIRDISRQRLAEEEANKHREELAHVDRVNMLGEMATGIAHEINQPLTAISLFSEAGKRLFNAGNSDKLPEIFDKLSSHATRAGAVIERMQAMARHHDSIRELADCNSLVIDVAGLAEVDARIRDIIIELELTDAPIFVDVDPVQIQQVVLNLLRNGMEAMTSIECANGYAIKLSTVLREDDYVEVAIVDSGSGVSSEAAESLFTPFTTTKKSGMGMGLSICQAIISAHGGQIDFENNSTGGARFYFTLPVVEQGELQGDADE